MKTANALDQLLATCIEEFCRSKHPEQELRRIHQQFTHCLNERDFPSCLSQRFQEFSSFFEQADPTVAHEGHQPLNEIKTLPALQALIQQLIALYADLQTHRAPRMPRDWFQETVLQAVPSRNASRAAQ